MRHLLILAILTIAFPSFAEEDPQLVAFAGIKLDTHTLEEAEEILITKGYKQFSKSGNVIAYTGSVAGIDALIGVTDVNGKAGTVTVMFGSDSEISPYKTYNGLKNDFTTIQRIVHGKYGKPKASRDSLSYPYDEDDRQAHGLTALSIGKYTLLDLWEYKTDNGASYGRMLEAQPNRRFRLLYQGKAAADLNKDQSEKTAGDL